MKRIILIVIALLVGSYFVNSFLDSKSKRQSVKTIENKKDDAIRSSVSDMILKSHAIDKWDKILSKDEAYRDSPIFTIELEKLWLKTQPILFVGVIRDITSYNETTYTVLIERSFYGQFEYTFDTNLQISVHSSKEQIDRFLEQNPTLFKDNYFNDNVAVIAHINNIRNEYFITDEGVRRETKIGEGKLVDILHVGDIKL